MADKTQDGVDKIKQKQKKNIFQLLGIIVLLLLINLGVFYFNGKLDLTRDHRYTITPTTKSMLQQLPEEIKVTVFLDGENMPAAFKKLSRSTKELLQNFREISKNKVSFQIIDPLGDDTLGKAILKTYGLSGVPVTINAGKKGTEQKMLFPWAIVTKESDTHYESGFPVFLQQSNTPQLSRSVLLQSEMLLEYNIANAIHQVTKPDVSSIAYLTGNGEPFGYEVYSALRALNQFYRLDTLNLQTTSEISQNYAAVILNAPIHPFSDVDKYKLDHYLMEGGNLFINVDGATGSLDSFNVHPQFNSMPLKLDLDDQLYTYGVRLNHDLLTDAVNSAGIPLTANGNNPEPVIYPWVYFPVLQAGSDHPIVKNLNGVLGRFVSTLDTNGNDPSVRKTILLSSSDYSKIEPTPAPILLESAMVEKNPATFRQKKLVAALLLEGKFPSAFSTQFPQDVKNYMDLLGLSPIQTANKPGKIIIASDGQLMKNEFSENNGPSELGVYRFSDYMFDNKAFLLNSMEYLTDSNNLLAARAKTFERHLLDPKRSENERKKWQIINIAVPVASVVLLGVVFFFIRKKKYG